MVFLAGSARKIRQERYIPHKRQSEHRFISTKYISYRYNILHAIYVCLWGDIFVPVSVDSRIQFVRDLLTTPNEDIIFWRWHGWAGIHATMYQSSL